jgi:hypothetical protein
MVRRGTCFAAPFTGALANLAWVALLVGCGARTELGEGNVDGGAETSAGDAAPSMDAPKLQCPAAPPPSTPLTIPTFVDVGPFLASSGCSFAATWVDLDDHQVPGVEAATFRAPEGEWQSSKLRVARGTLSSGLPLNAAITWDGSAYVIGWVDGALFLQRMAEDGTLLGPATRSFSTNDVLVWLAPRAQGELRVGLASMSGFEGGNGVAAVSYARVLSDGTLTLPPTIVANAAVCASFGRADDSNEVLSVRGPDQSLSVESFDDDGVVQNRTPVAASGGPFSSLVGNYFAYLPNQVPGPDVVLGEVGSATRVRVPGDYVPLLAATDLGAVGMLCDSDAGLLLSVFHGTTLDSSTHLPSKNFTLTSDSYAIAGGQDSFGALWIIDTGSGEALAFTVLTP